MKTFKVNVSDKIRKTSKGYKVIGNNTGKNLGTYPSRKKAEEREAQVRYFMYGKDIDEDGEASLIQARAIAKSLQESYQLAAESLSRLGVALTKIDTLTNALEHESGAFNEVRDYIDKSDRDDLESLCEKLKSSYEKMVELIEDFTSGR